MDEDLRIKPKWLRVAALYAVGVLLLSGLFLYGPVALPMPAWIYVPLLKAFLASAFTLFLLGAVYTVRSYAACRHGRTWRPVLILGTTFAAALALLAALGFKLPLWHEYLFMYYFFFLQSGLIMRSSFGWLILAMVTALLSGVALVFLLAVKLWAMLLRPRGDQAHPARQ